MRIWKSILLITLAGSTSCSTTAWAQTRVLFVGNSFTYGASDVSEQTERIGGVPEIFSRLAQAGGYTNLTVVMRAVGGQDYLFHSTNTTSQNTIFSQPWTCVVLQDYSTEPTHLVDGYHSLAHFYTYGTFLYLEAMTNNPQTQVILYETWSRAAAHSLITGVSTPSSFASTTQFQTELRTNYQNLAASLNSTYSSNPPVIVAPCGDAWQNAGALRAATDPGFAGLFAGDNYHGNDNGYYLSAAVFYAKILGANPLGLSTNPLVSGLNLQFTIPPGFLEQVAWATVNGSTQAPVAFVRQPVSQTIAQSLPANFSTSVVGTPPYTVQWFSNGVPIPGASQLSYTIPSVTTNLDGTLYAVSVSNSVNEVTSTNAVLAVVSSATNAQTFLFDFGGANTTLSGPSPNDPLNHWNNVTTSIGGSSSGQLANLVDSQNNSTTLGLVMLSRFNSVNENGTTSFARFPQNATRDSLYGNTETFNGLANISPSFKIVGLNPATSYNFTFYASRTGVSDNRETGYTVQGSRTGFATLNVANNISNMVTVTNMQPTGLGELTISLAPTTNNSSANHFTYLGLMQIVSVATTNFVVYSASPTNGFAPLNVQFTAPGVDTGGNAITSWNWDFGDGATSTLQNPAHLYTTISNYVPVLVVTNSLGLRMTASGPPVSAQFNAGLVNNGSFESGDLTSWAVTGDASYTGVSGALFPPRSGQYEAILGTSTAALSYLSQTLDTAPGTSYVLSCWMNNAYGDAGNIFTISWDGTTLLAQTNPPAASWSNFQFVVTATSPSTVLRFGYVDSLQSYLGLDDISVLAALPAAPPTITRLSVSGNDLVLNGSNGVSGHTYYVLTTTNPALPLIQWSPVATNVLNANGSFTIIATNAVRTDVPESFYLLQTQ